MISLDAGQQKRGQAVIEAAWPRMAVHCRGQGYKFMVISTISEPRSEAETTDPGSSSSSPLVFRAPKECERGHIRVLRRSDGATNAVVQEVDLVWINNCDRAPVFLESILDIQGDLSAT